MAVETIHDRIGTARDDLTTAQRLMALLSLAGLWAVVVSCFTWLQTRAGIRSTTERREDLLTSP